MRQVQVSGVILAAGPSRRFGIDPPKQLARIEGETLVRRVVRQAVGSALMELILVTGLAADAVAAAVEGLDVRVVVNPRYLEGQSTSVKAGLARVGNFVDAAMFLPVDQPHLTAEVIDVLIECYRKTRALIVVPAYEGRRGAPVVIDRSLFDVLSQIEGDEGGRQIFQTFEADLVECPLTSASALRDVDGREDLGTLED